MRLFLTDGERSIMKHSERSRQNTGQEGNCSIFVSMSTVRKTVSNWELKWTIQDGVGDIVPPVSEEKTGQEVEICSINLELSHYVLSSGNLRI